MQFLIFHSTLNGCVMFDLKFASN